MNLSYRYAKKEDADTLVRIYNDAFYADYVRFGECPGYGKTKEEMEASIEKSLKQIIFYEDKPIGSLSYKEMSENVYYVGCLCIVPEYQGKGIGTLAFQHILEECTNWEKIILKTPLEKEENIRFYTKKCGMQPGKVQKDGNVDVVELVLESDITVR